MGRSDFMYINTDLSHTEALDFYLRECIGMENPEIKINPAQDKATAVKENTFWVSASTRSKTHLTYYIYKYPIHFSFGYDRSAKWPDWYENLQEVKHSTIQIILKTDWDFQFGMDDTDIMRIDGKVYLKKEYVQNERYDPPTIKLFK